MFVGYAIDHTGDTYQMWDPTTSRVHKTRDVIWMKQMFYSPPTFTNGYAVVKDDPTIAIPQQAGESREPEESDLVEQEPANNSLKERDDDDGKTELESDSSTGTTPVASTRLGRTITKPSRLIKESGMIMPDLEPDLGKYEIRLTRAEEQYYEAMPMLQEGEFVPGEVNCVGAGIGRAFVNTKELHARDEV
jgi:hypothetical protein